MMQATCDIFEFLVRVEVFVQAGVRVGGERVNVNATAKSVSIIESMGGWMLVCAVFLVLRVWFVDGVFEKQRRFR